MSPSMVVIASTISVQRLGDEVQRTTGPLDAGKAIDGGLGFELLATVLDRLAWDLGRSTRERGVMALGTRAALWALFPPDRAEPEDKPD